MMNRYAETALKSVELIRNNTISPELAWKQAAESIFPDNYDAQVKGCPKGAFLGLCSAGLMKGVSAGEYTNAKRNAGYATQAVEILSLMAEAPEPAALWKLVLNGEEKAHNSQMNVVLALWQAGELGSES